MHPVTLHGVGVITKLYFSIFAAFKESVTLNLAQRSFKVIDLGTNHGTNRKRVYIFLLVVNSNLDQLSCTVSEIRFKCRKSTIFPTPFIFRQKFGGVPFGVDPRCCGLPIEERLGYSAPSALKLFSINSNLYDHDTST